MRIQDILLQRRKRWNALLYTRFLTEGKELECPACKGRISLKTLSSRNWICPECGHDLPMPAGSRISMLCDEGTYTELFASMRPRDPLNFPGYREKLERGRRKTGLTDAFVAGRGMIDRNKVAIGILDGRFLMGSMGSLVGEKIARLVEYAGRHHLPLILFCASGGARMQEGLFSLMQMAKTSAAIERFKREGGLYISCLTNPTTGGVSASFASLGDIIIAEPDALICFAGPRVIEQTIGQKLPKEFQHAEFLLEHGMIDLIAGRREQKALLAKILRLHRKEKRPA